MSTITYILNIIRRFGLFGTVDGEGLLEELTAYNTTMADDPEWRAHNTRLLRAMNEVTEIRRKLGAAQDKWVDEILTEHVASSASELPFPTNLPPAGSIESPRRESPGAYVIETDMSLTKRFVSHANQQQRRELSNGG